MKLFQIAFPALMLFQLGAAQGPPRPPPPPEHPPQIALDIARSNWNSFNKGYYDFEYTHSTLTSRFEGYPWTVKVRRGNVAEVLFANGTAVPDANPPTIDDLLTRIQQAINDNAPRVNIYYSPNYGYPIDMTIDYNARTADDEFYAEIHSFTEVAPYDAVRLQAELTSNKNLWDSYSVDGYRFAYSEQCMMCHSLNYPWEIEVRDHDNTRARDSLGNAVVSSEHTTVQDLFDVLQDALDNDAFDIQVSFNKGVGFPTSVSILYEHNLPDHQFSADIATMTIFDNPQAELALAKSIWDASGFSSYDYLFQMGSPGPLPAAFPWRVRVSSNEIVSVRDRWNHAVVSLVSPRIDDIFRIILTALDENALTVDVTYSEASGLPENVFIDLTSSRSDADEIRVQISQFAPLVSLPLPPGPPPVLQKAP